MEYFRAHAQSVGESVGAGRHDHEFLEVQRIVGMRAAIDDVHHRHWQDARIDAAQILIERQPRGLPRRLCDRQRHAENGVRPEAALVLGAVEHNQRFVDAALLLGFHALQSVEDLAVHGLDRERHALAQPGVAAVAQLMRLMRAGRGARGNAGAAEIAAFQDDVDFNRRIAPAIQDLAADDVCDCGHDDVLCI